MEGSKKIEMGYASLTPMYNLPVRTENAYHYDLVVPHLLSKDQMELILRMVGQMKQETPHLFVLEFFWEKEEP